MTETQATYTEPEFEALEQATRQQRAEHAISKARGKIPATPF